MSGFHHFLLSFCILGYSFCSSRAWVVHMPSYIKGLKGSCLVIPCTFDYNWYPPTDPYRVVWYQYVDRGFPLVYDNRNPNDVIGIFRGNTKQYDTSFKRCSLLIYTLDCNHHGQKIYPWVDPENVGWRTYKFYDKTVTIEVVGSADKPHLSISGEKTVGKSVEVECTVYHTCPVYPPTLTLNIPLKSHTLVHTTFSGGQIRTTLKTRLDIVTDQQAVECSVKHDGGLTATAVKTLNAECSFSPLTISPTSADFLEGNATNVTCTARFTCSSDIPVLTWNYNNMPASTNTFKDGDNQWRTVSTLTFTASANDSGKALTCFAHRLLGETTMSLNVKSEQNN